MYETLLMWFGYGLCHQLPERSFFGGGIQVPVCARDTGIYFGFVISLLVIAALQRNRPSGLPSPGVSVLLGALVLSMAVDGVTSYAGLRESSNSLRLITGLAAGYAMGAIAVPLINDELWRRSSQQRVLSGVRTLALWLVSLGLAFLLISWGAPLLGGFYPLLSVAAVLATLTSVNLVMVCVVSRFERKAEHLRDAWLPILLAFVLAWAEVALCAGLKVGLDRLVG